MARDGNLRPGMLTFSNMAFNQRREPVELVAAHVAIFGSSGWEHKGIGHGVKAFINNVKMSVEGELHFHGTASIRGQLKS